MTRPELLAHCKQAVTNAHGAADEPRQSDSRVLADYIEPYQATVQ